MKAKIIGTVFALPPLSSPPALVRWFLAWKRTQILKPAFDNCAKAMHKAADAFRAFAEVAKALEEEEVRRGEDILKEAFENPDIEDAENG